MLVAASGKASFTMARMGNTDLGDAPEFIHAKFCTVSRAQGCSPARFTHASARSQQCGSTGNADRQPGRQCGEVHRSGWARCGGWRRHPHHVAARVIDAGVGMASESVDALFEAFRQGDVWSEALGLGLWIVKHTAEAPGVSVQGLGARQGNAFHAEHTVGGFRRIVD